MQTGNKVVLWIRRLACVIFLGLVLCWYAPSHAETYYYRSETWLGVGQEDHLPFWLVNNRNGRPQDENHLAHSIFVGGDYLEYQPWGLSVSSGIEGIGYLSETSELKLHQAYLYIHKGPGYLVLGKFQKPLPPQASLSLSGDSVLESGNAAPYPKVDLQIDQWIDMPYLGDWLSLKGGWSEGWLDDDSYVKNTLVHHKHLLARVGGERPVQVTFGLEHYVEWNGDHPVFGRINTNYWDVVTARKQAENNVSTEAHNVSGNHLGSWRGGVLIKTSLGDLTLYRKTIFEDKSGYKKRFFQNPDGLNGVSFLFRKDGLLKQITYEYFYSMYQSGTSPTSGQDNYFNNGLYKSGWTYEGRTIGIPLITPLDHGLGVFNNRIKAHHVGIRGQLQPDFRYRMLATYSQNYGTYEAPFPSRRDQLSILLEGGFSLGIGWNAVCGLGVDSGDMFKDQAGIMCNLTKTGILN